MGQIKYGADSKIIYKKVEKDFSESLFRTPVLSPPGVDRLGNNYLYTLMG